MLAEAPMGQWHALLKQGLRLVAVTPPWAAGALPLRPCLPWCPFHTRPEAPMGVHVRSPLGPSPWVTCCPVLWG